LLAGSFKADQNLAKIIPQNIDLTVSFGVIVVITICFKIIKRNFFIPRVRKEFLSPLLFLIFLMGVSLLYTLSPIYGTDKFLRFCFITCLAALAPIFLFDKKEKIINFFYTLIVISSAMVFTAIAALHSNTQFHSAFGSNYLALGRNAGMAALLVLYYFFLRCNKNKEKLFWIIVFSINFIGLLYGGGRMPVIAFGMAIFLITMKNIFPMISKKKAQIVKIGLFIASLSFIALLCLPSFFSTFFDRMKIFFQEEGGGSSVLVRRALYFDAVKAFLENPIVGVGLGGFSVFSSGIDSRLYPHNIFLELAAETGVIGLILFLVLLFFCFKHLIFLEKRDNQDERFLATAVLVMLIFFFFNVLISGDINDNRIFFSWIGISYSLDKVCALNLDFKSARCKNQ
jgi:O-antigen ligase